jgi:hypothetical protein
MCTDFATKYNDALKIKLNSENIFKIDDLDLIDYDENEDAQTSAKQSNNKRKEKLDKKRKKKKNSKFNEVENKNYNNNNKIKLISPNTSLSKIKFNMKTIEKNQINLAFGQHATSIDADEDSNEQYDLDIDEGQNEDESDNDDENSTSNSTSLSASSSTSSACSNPCETDNKNQTSNSMNNKRGVLPKNATNIMKKWLFQHIAVRCIKLFILIELLCSELEPKTFEN